MTKKNKKKLHLQSQKVKISFESQVTFCQPSQQVDFKVEITDDMLFQSGRQDGHKKSEIYLSFNIGQNMQHIKCDDSNVVQFL